MKPVRSEVLRVRYLVEQSVWFGGKTPESSVFYSAARSQMSPTSLFVVEGPEFHTSIQVWK